MTAEADDFRESTDTSSNSESNPGSDYLDILGNGLIFKKTLVAGQGRDSRPNHGDVVTVQCRGHLEDGTEVDCIEELTFIVGDGDVIQAFDLGISLSERLEEFELISAPRFAYGEKGREPDVPANAKITYWMKLLRNDDPPDYAKMSLKKLLTAADEKRERGNFLYRREEYALSVNSYMKAQKVLESAPSNMPEPNAAKELLEMKLKISNNLAAAQLKIEAYDAAIESSNFVLLHEPENVKAIFRKGKAVSGKGDQLEAMALFKRALVLEPGSRLAKSELARSRRLWQDECEQRARVCRRMFGKMSTDSTAGKSSGGIKALISRYGMIAGAVLSVCASIALATVAIRYNTAGVDLKPDSF